MKTLSSGIDEVAAWSSDYINIPAMQRGLVWSPNQVELLWDSILRGFPIGAFVFVPTKGNEGQLTENLSGKEDGYFLLDGQQRYNAIKAAYTEWSDDARSVLWIDFMPPENVRTTRRFWIRVTTKAHPWGFANNDECSVLGWTLYREALERFVGNRDARVQDVPMSKAWPFKARCPIPFCDVHEMSRKSDDDAEFFVKVKSWCEAHPNVGIGEKDWQTVASTSKMLFSALKGLEGKEKGYKIISTVLEMSTLSEYAGTSEDAVRESRTSDLEQLFTRLNTLGTPISPYDLRYSAIKAYWGENVRVNDEIASEIMPAAHLAVLAFRLALTVKSDKLAFADVPSVMKIRTMGLQRKDPACEIVDELYANGGKRLRSLIKGVEKALAVYRNCEDSEDGLPAALRTSIILNSPDVYLLLLYMAYKGVLLKFEKTVGLATWLHWFSIDKKKAVDRLRTVMDTWCEGNLKAVLRKLVEDRIIIHPIAVNDTNFGDPWQFQQKDFKWSSCESQEWYPLLSRIRSQRELIYFATRKYFNRTFQYDPSETKFFTGHNRPWDMDHVVPKHWVSRQGKSMGEWQNQCLDWVWSIGNFAPISFSANRAKGDRANWKEYEANATDLMFDGRVIDGIRDEVLTRDENMAKLFIEITHGRLVRMYEDWRKTVLGLI